MLLKLIGQGGMGRVYLARDTRLNRQVALKILAPERINNPLAMRGSSARRGSAPSCSTRTWCAIYDFGEFNGRLFLVMEYIDGKSSGAFIQEQGAMPPATAVRLVRQIAMGLEHAHRKGLIHRDVNPYNILVTRDGTAKLADLGLAIEVADEERVTRDGATIGTFDYVAPEQARHSHAADVRSDIYSLGCTLYHMIAGQVPFPSPSLPEKLLGHQAMEPTPLNQLVPGSARGTERSRPPNDAQVSQRAIRHSVPGRAGTGALSGRTRRGDQPRRGGAIRPPAGAAQSGSPGSGRSLGAAGSGTRSCRRDRGRRRSTRPRPSRSSPAVLLPAWQVPRVRRRLVVLLRSPKATPPPAPRLSHVSDVDEDEIPLILDPGPDASPSEEVARLKSRFASFFTLGSASGPPRATDESGSVTATSASAHSAPMFRPTHFWLWGLIVLALMVTVLVVALALLGLAGSTPSGPAAPSPNASLG